MKSAREWKDYYRAERARFRRAELEQLFQRARTVELPDDGALIFPHTKLKASGELIAAAALAVVRSGCDTVLALGVLHGGREQDRERVQRARSGDAALVKELRGVHGPDVAGDQGIWTEEFSLDAFAELLAVAAELEQRPAPNLIVRYPFLVGENPADLPRIDELRRLIESGCGLVATADPVHYGAGYGTETRLGRTDGEALAFSAGSIKAELGYLARRDLKGFLEHGARVRSDFRDVGATLAELLGCPRALDVRIHELRLVDYADTLRAAEPTWVAAALTEVRAT